MRRELAVSCLVVGMVVASVARSDDYTVDPAHAGVAFKISHLGLSWTQGRFNAIDGGFRVDPDPAKCGFTFTIQADSVDTGNAKRDEHLRSPDFFNSKQFPLIAFKSTAVTPIEGGYEVTGDLTLHGVTKAVVFAIKGGGSAEFPPGVQRTGYTSNFVLKRSEFGMDAMAGPVGDEVYISISFEGVKR